MSPRSHGAVSSSAFWPALVVGAVALEVNARERIGLHAGDLDNSEIAWSNEKLRAAGAPAAIVGDSRILFDTDLDRFEAMTGIRPIQLAIHGTSALTLLENMADDPDFKGVLIVGLADTMFFQPFDGYGGYVKKWHEFRAPYRIVSNEIDHVLQRRIAFLDSNYRLSVVAHRLDPDFRPGVEGPKDDIWKLQEVGEHRQTWMWDRVEHDPAWRARTRWAWKGFKEKFPFTPELIAKGQARAKAAVDKIRARGGDVVFIRPPSAPQLRVNEEAQVPKAKGWDILVQEHAQRRRAHRRSAGGARPDAARVVASQPALRDRVHGRLCSKARGTHSPHPVARRRPTSTRPLLLRAEPY